MTPTENTNDQPGIFTLNKIQAVFVFINLMIQNLATPSLSNSMFEQTFKLFHFIRMQVRLKTFQPTLIKTIMFKRPILSEPRAQLFKALLVC